MEFIIYQKWSDLPSSCDYLFSEAEKESIFISREWFESISSQVINDSQKILLACVSDGNHVLALLPLLNHANKEWTSLTHPYSSLFSILLAKDNQAQVLQCLCEGLSKLDFEYLSLSPIASDDEKLKLFQHAMQELGLECYQTRKDYNWYHRFDKNQNYADYMAGRPSKVRNTLLRKQTKLKREHPFKIDLHIDTDIDDALASYHDIFKVSWKANEQHETLVKEAVKLFALRAWPRLAILSVDNNPIAAQLWFVANDKAYIFRLVYDERWKAYSPGSLLMTHLLEHVIDKDKVKEIDFLSGNDAYKKDWMSERRERMELVCVKKSPEEKDKPLGILSKLTIALFKSNSINK